MAGIRMENKIYEVGMYCRLSKDDGTDNESASIATQKSILTDYVKKQGWHLAKTYVDDGYSGTNFQRPSFQNMIKDIESGLINCVITKDLSRLGRNYLDCGLYLEVFFPEHNVRYIAVNDGVDTLNKSAMDITPFRNILNEMYSADVSVKIKSAYRARFQQGKFMGTTAPLEQIFMVISHVWIIRFRNCQTRCYGVRTSWKTSRCSWRMPKRKHRKSFRRKKNWQKR